MFLMKFNWVDIFFVTLVVRTCYVGFKKGFLPELFRFLGLLTAFITSFTSYTLLSRFLSGHTKWPGARLETISFLVIFLGIVFIFKVLSMIVAVPLINGKDISGNNRLAGLILGFGRGVMLASLIYICFTNAPFGYLSNSAKERSFSGQYVSGIASKVYNACIKFYPWIKTETPLVKVLDTGSTN